jgi:hypothetical protein
MAHTGRSGFRRGRKGRQVNWILCALRDWRVWALTLTIQGPGVRAIVRYAPSPWLVLVLVFVAGFIFYSACLHGPLAPWLRRAGSSPGVVAAVLCAAAVINAAVYPRVDGLKALGRGSDEDDALIVTAQRLVTGQRPLYVPTYLGNTPSVGPAWAALVAPLAITRTYALLIPLALAVLVWTVRRAGGGDTGTALALVLPLTSIGFWELSVTGSDLFAVGVLFVVLTTLAWGWRTPAAGTSVAALVLACAAASSRAAFVWVTLSVALFMWRTRRVGVLMVAGATVATAAAEAWFWWPDPNRTPLHLITKLTGLLGGSGVALAVAAAVASTAWALSRLDDTMESWWSGLWTVLVLPLAIVSVGALRALGWRIADWQAAGYVEVAVPALVAFVALQTARRSTAEAP